jgi:hypothetical protein
MIGFVAAYPKLVVRRAGLEPALVCNLSYKVWPPSKLMSWIISPIN